MFDVRLRAMIDPALNAMARKIAAGGMRANALTITGAAVGVAAGFAVYGGHFALALGLIALNRLLDGLDGAVARIQGATAWGGYLDSLCDYLFYLAIPLGFTFLNPANAPAALLLVASFTLTAVSFLALAAILAGRDTGHGAKAFSYSSGLMEGGETIAFFVAMALFPAHFAPLALVFAALCILTVAQRLWQARILLRPESTAS